MKRKANQEELRAQDYLNSLGYSKVEYEPIGNVTPDFVIDKRIAVEVRRLNRNYVKDDQLISIENFDETNKKTNHTDNPTWISHELERNIQLVIDEKDKKIEHNFHLYNEWWLVLIDYITNSHENNTYQELKNIQFNTHKFNKVIIISRENNFQAFEL